MKVHANAALGPAGRLALVEAIESGMTLRAAAAALNVAPATAHRWWHRRLRASSEELRSRSWLLDRSSRPHRSPRLLDPETQERICEWRERPGWGARPVVGRGGRPPPPVWEGRPPPPLPPPARGPREGGPPHPGAPPPGPLPPARAAGEVAPPLRVALPRRPPAHGHLTLRALRAPRPRGHRRPLAALPEVDGPEDQGRLRLLPRDRRRPHPPGLRRAAPRREGGDRHRLRGKGACLLRLPRDHHQAADDRQRLRLREEPLAARAAGRRRDQAPAHPALSPADQRQGRALPPDDGEGVGLRRGLSLTPPSQRGPATLAAPLQRDEAPQLTWGPARRSAAFTTSVGRTPR